MDTVMEEEKSKYQINEIWLLSALIAEEKDEFKCLAKNVLMKELPHKKLKIIFIFLREAKIPSNILLKALVTLIKRKRPMVI